MASPSRLEIAKGSNASPMLLVIFGACRFLVLKPAVLPGSTIRTLSPVYRYRRHRTAHSVPSVLAWNLVSHHGRYVQGFTRSRARGESLTGIGSCPIGSADHSLYAEGNITSQTGGVMMRLGLILAALLCSPSLISNAAPPAQCGITSTPIKFPANAQGVPIALSDTADTLLFRLRAGQMSLDLDGNEHTYGVKDQGIDGICNGLSALNPQHCAGVTPRGECFGACQSALRAWDGTPAGAKGLFCSVGLGSGCGPTFFAPLQSAPNQDFFVSETSTNNAPPPQAPRNWVETQAAQIDPLVIPYFVLPPALRGPSFDASPGDAGVMIRTDHVGAPVFFIIGDLGNNDEIGELSARLHQLLSTSGVLPTKQQTSAFGQPVSRLTMDPPPEVAVAIFRHSSQRPNNAGSLISLTPDTIIDWINSTATDRMNRLGGADAVIQCAPHE